MFAQKMKLRGKVRLELNGTLIFSGRLYDKTPFSMQVTKHDVQLNEPLLPSKMMVEGWLYVSKESQQADRCYLTLPKPTIQFGRQITVSEYDLMPPNVTLESFKEKPSEDSSLDTDTKKVKTKKATKKKVSSK